MPDLASLSWLLIAALFGAAAALVWWAGTRLPSYVAAIEVRTKMGQAFAGMVLLGGITTLPELATAGTAATLGAGEMAVNNAFGSISFNLVLLAVGDAVSGRPALTSIIARPVTLLQGVLGMLLLAVAAAAAASPDVAFLGAGLWSWALFAATISALWIASRYERRPAWIVAEPPPSVDPPEELGMDLALPTLVLRTSGLAILILIGGSVLASTGEEISTRSGIDAGLVGFLLVALATSLPELSTVVGAMRRRHYELAFGDIFGANLFNVAILFVVDILHPGQPVMSLAGPSESIAALLGVVLTGCFVIGLLERRDRRVWRLGYDSVAAIGVYLLGAAFLATLAAG
jgi:cation:H+ antiporter